MKLYTSQAPNPFRVNAFIAEKEISIPIQIVDILGGETRTDAFAQINTLKEVPVLQLDDGTLLTESMAICRYLEAVNPARPLLGSTPVEMAQIEMWSRRLEQRVFGLCSDLGLHTMPLFADKIPQVPAYAQTLPERLHKAWAWLDGELSDGRTFVVNDRFSVADITGMAALFIMNFVDLNVSERFENVKRWETACRARPIWGEPVSAG